MLKLIIKQTNWGIVGAIFAFSIGFFVKIYVIDAVGLDNWGKYVIAHTFSSFSETILSFGLPFIILKFIPNIITHDSSKASRIASIFIKYALFTGLLYAIVIYFCADTINRLIYNDIEGLNGILFLMCLNVPISMLFGVIVSLYRSLFKIKEIVIYGTFITVTLRAIITFIIFNFTDNISYFILIEVFVQILVLSLLLYIFNRDNFPIFVASNLKEFTDDKEIINYGKKMFYNSIIAFVSVHALKFVISLTLSPKDVGAYSILITLSSLTTFLLINLNKVFAPAISKLYKQRNFSELNFLYKKTTLLMNLMTLPLVISIILFADEILILYTLDMLEYKNYLFLMIYGGLISLATGSSGNFMIMAGLEKENLNILLIKSILIILLAFYLIPIYGMLSIVILYIVFMFFVNITQLYYIKNSVNVSPYSIQLFKLFLLTVFMIIFAVNQQYTFNSFHFIILPIFIYLIYFLLMIKSVKQLINDIIK